MVFLPALAPHEIEVSFSELVFLSITVHGLYTEVAHNRAEKKVLGRGCLKLILALAELLL